MNSVSIEYAYDNNTLTRIYSPDDLANLVKDSVEYYKRQASKALAEAAKTREEVRAEITNGYEKENQYLKAELKRSVCILGSDQELISYNQFCSAHEKCRSSARINSGKIPYVIQTHNGIGVSSVVVCPICNARQDITDIRNW